MSLSPAEEAQTRELLAQQAAILSLADSEPAIVSNLGATDVSLSDLTAATAVSDSDLLLIRQGTTDKSVTPSVIGFATKTGVQSGAYSVASSGGTADAITLTLTPTQTAFSPGPTWWRATSANATTTPTLKRDGMAAKTIVKGNNLAVGIADIPGAGAWMCSQYDQATDKEVLLNPSTGVNIIGIGQSWHNVAASRAMRINYTNTTGKPIAVHAVVTVGTNPASAILVVSGLDLYGSSISTVGQASAVGAIIPPGVVYQLTDSAVTGSIQSWLELR